MQLKMPCLLEEYACLCTVYELDKFFDEIAGFLSAFRTEKTVFDDLLVFQKTIIKKPFDSEITVTANHNFDSYFNNILDAKLTACRFEKTVRTKPFANWEQYAKVVAWYGRKDDNCTYIKHL